MNKFKNFLEERKRKGISYFRGDMLKEMKEGFAGISSRYPASPREITPFSKILSLTLCWEVESWEETEKYLLVQGKKNKLYFIKN